MFEIAKTGAGYDSTPTTLADFNGDNGTSPYGSLFADASGNLFGTAHGGGAYANGTVFEITGAGFAAACYARGTLIAVERGEIAIEHLRVGDRVLTASGTTRPVRWLGHRTVNCARHPEPRKVWPVPSARVGRAATYSFRQITQSMSGAC